MKINKGITAVGTPLGVNIPKKWIPLYSNPFISMLYQTILAKKKVNIIWLVSVNTKGKIPKILKKKIHKNKKVKNGA